MKQNSDIPLTARVLSFQFGEVTDKKNLPKMTKTSISTKIIVIVIGPFTKW